MKSKVAESAKRSTSAAMLRLSPEQRLDAFVVHCRLMMDLYRAGQELRAAQSRQRQ